MAQHTSTTSGSKGRRGVFRSMFLIWQNLIGALLSVPVLVTGILIAKEHRGDGEDCATFMDNPIIAMGALLLFVSLVGLVVAIFDRKFKLRHPLVALFHLLLMFFLVILLFCFAIFSLEITNKDLAHTVNGYGQSYKEYRLNEYPKWMRHRVEDARYWSKVKFCLQESSVCKAGILPNIFSNITHVSLAKLKPIQGDATHIQPVEACLDPCCFKFMHLYILPAVGCAGKEQRKSCTSCQAKSACVCLDREQKPQGPAL